MSTPLRVPYESPLHAVADKLIGLYCALFRVASAQRLHCDKCGWTGQWMTQRQQRQLAAGVPVTCGRLTWGRRVCTGHLQTVACAERERRAGR